MVLVSVGFVDVCVALERHVRRCPSRHDAAADSTESAASIDTLSARVRALDDSSDAALRGLLDLASTDPGAVEAIVVALLPLALSRCRRSRDRVDELIGELAIVIAEAARDGLPASHRRVANVLLDRAWGRVRRPAQRVGDPVPIDALDVSWRLVDPAPDPADVAIDRVALDRLADGLRAHRSSHAALVRAWNVAVGLANVEEPSKSDRARLKYARQVLRRALAADLVA